MSKLFKELVLKDNVFTLYDNKIQKGSYLKTEGETHVWVEINGAEMLIVLYPDEWEKSMVVAGDDFPWCFTSIDSLKEWLSIVI